MYYRTSADGTYTLLPEKWQSSFYWSFDALSNYILYAQYDDGAVTDKEVQFVNKNFAALQKEIYREFDRLNKKLFRMKNAATSSAARSQVTQSNEKLSRLAHQTALSMFYYVKYGNTNGFK